MPLSKEQRDALPAEHFAVPNKRRLPIHDAVHTRLAWDMVSRTKDLTEAERGAARTRILRRAKQLGIDTIDWEKKLSHGGEIILVLEAMSIVLPAVDDHPNRMPFKGVLTFLDTPSDAAVGGAGGKRTYLPRAVAEAALPSLLAMGIDFTPDFDGHDATRKIGLIETADIVGNAIHIEGFFYAADFPQECARIKAEKEDLGFSYEIRAQTREMGNGLLQIVSGVFTGAAVLRKDKAAYQSTSLAAQAVEDIEMTKEELEALLKASIGPIADQLKALGTDVAKLKAGTDPLQASKEMRERVAPHSTALRNCAAAMEAAGIGLHSSQGHVRFLHHMAASMDADAAQGKLPHIYRDHDWSFSHAANVHTQDPPKIEDSPAIKAITATLAELGTKLTDLSAKAFQASPTPERKTLSSEATLLLAKTGLKPDDKSGKVSIAKLDAAAEAARLDRTQSIALKLSLQQAGMLEAA